MSEKFSTLGEQVARVLLFAGPKPVPSSQTRKAKRLHRESLRLYEWRKKWAERRF